MPTHAQFQWQCQPKAEAIIQRILDECCRRNSFVDNLKNDLYKHSSTRLLDWADHVVVGYSDAMENELLESGFESEQASSAYRVFHHPGAQLPRVILKDRETEVFGVALSVDSIADFLLAHGMGGKIEGSSYSGYRRSVVSTENNATLWVVERRGIQTMEPIETSASAIEKYLLAKEKWQTRPRGMADQDESMRQSIELVQEIVACVGEDMAAWIVLECEREYWQSRNMAGQIQKNRQDALGMGWANHDHHTFRSSRKRFYQLVRLFEMLGFHCRERYYAGKEAGWGAQIMENPRCRLVLFLDVDLLADEIDIDFAHHPLPPIHQLGTIGLWCELHGDSILKAGMHHLEAQFMFEDLKDDLMRHGVRMMEPFSNFPYLRQAFTEGQIWRVDPEIVKRLLSEKKLTQEQADKFIAYGAVGSHLENLQRREGYKGFNQKNVSVIIRKTDPRILGSSSNVDN